MPGNITSQPRRALAATSILLLATNHAAAQTSADDVADVPALQEILISERSIENTLPMELANFGVDLEVVTEAQVRNHAFVDVAQSLEMLVPGLHLTSQAGAFSYVNVQMQGSRSSDILWTLDGVRINNRLYNSTSPADTLPASMIERTEVLKGSHGLMYGTQAIAGVINVVTRGFSETTDGNVTVGTGSDGLQRINGYVRGALGQDRQHKLVLWASKDKSDGYEIYDNYQPIDQPSAQPTATDRKRSYDVDSIGLKYGFDFTPDLSMSMTGIHTRAELGYPNVSRMSINDRNEDIVSAKLDYIPSDIAKFIVKGYYHSWDTDYYTPPNPSDYWGYEDMGISAATELSPGGIVDYHLGYDFQTYTGEDDYLLIARQREKVHAVYGQVRSNDDFSERARFAAGLRYNNTGGNDSTVGNVSGVYDITENLYVQGMVATSFMLPSAENLYRIHCPSGDNCTHGNASLAPEESVGYNLSVGGQLTLVRRDLSWQVTGWDRRVDNLITRAPILVDELDQYPAGFAQTFTNISDEVKVTGAEILLRGPVSDSLTFDVSYTFSKEINRGTGEQIQDRPRRQYKGSLAYSSPTLPFGANLAVKYVGDKNSDVTGFGVQDYGDYTVLDAGVHAWLDDAERHRLTLRLENLLDEEYATAIGSAALTGSDSAERFGWRRLGVPRTVHLNYSYSF